MSGETPLSSQLLRGIALPRPDAGGDKNTRGAVLAAGGCREVPGALLLAGTAALRAGAGRLQLASCHSLTPLLGIALPEARVIGLPETDEGHLAPEAGPVLAKRGAGMDALLLGPGIFSGPDAEALTAAMLEGLPGGGEGPALVLDAAALVALKDQRQALRRHAGRVVITPHDGEMAQLLGRSREEVRADPLAAAREAAALLKVVVVMKGGHTRIVTPQGEAWGHAAGNAGLATSGSGDVLAGIVAALLARGAPPLHAALWGVHLHAEAGRRLTRSQGALGFLAREVPAEVPRILAEFDEVSA